MKYFLRKLANELTIMTLPTNMWQMCPSHVKIKIFRCRCRPGTEGESDGNHIPKWDPLSNYHFTMIRKTDTR